MHFFCVSTKKYHRVCLRSALINTAKWFSKVIVQICIPNNRSVRLSVAPYTCQYLALAVYCIFSQTGWCRNRISSLFSFSWWLVRLRILLHIYVHLYLSFCEASFQVCGPLLYWILSLLCF